MRWLTSVVVGGFLILCFILATENCKERTFALGLVTSVTGNDGYFVVTTPRGENCVTGTIAPPKYDEAVLRVSKNGACGDLEICTQGECFDVVMMNNCKDK